MPGTPDPWGNGGRHQLRASAGPTFGVDLHPTYQAGFSVDQAAAQGIGFMACKVSEATWTYDSRPWLNRAQAVGLPACGYHYLHPGQEDQQAQVFAAQLAAAGNAPGLLDAEALTTGGQLVTRDGQGIDSGGMGHHPHPDGGNMRASQVRDGAATPAATLTVAGIRAFLSSAARYGANVRVLYLPLWYWQRMGSPDLSPLALPLWASSYPSGDPGTPAQLYPAVDPGRWGAYGGLPTAVLQFSQTGIAGGISPVDLDAFLGTRDQLATLLGITTTKGEPVSEIRIDVDTDGSFRVPVMAEAGGNSAVVARAWITFGSTWGATHFVITALDGSRNVMDQMVYDLPDNGSDVFPLPDGTRMATLEGHVVDGGAIPAAALVVQTR